MPRKDITTATTAISSSSPSSSSFAISPHSNRATSAGELGDELWKRHSRFKDPFTRDLALLGGETQQEEGKIIINNNNNNNSNIDKQSHQDTSVREDCAPLADSPSSVAQQQQQGQGDNEDDEINNNEEEEEQVASRQRQEGQATRYNKTSHVERRGKAPLVPSISTTSLASSATSSNTPSSPPSLRSGTSTTPTSSSSFSISSLPSSSCSVILLESPTSPCPSEGSTSQFSLLSNSTTSSPSSQLSFPHQRSNNKRKNRSNNKMTSGSSSAAIATALTSTSGLEGNNSTNNNKRSSASHTRNISNGSTSTNGGGNSVNEGNSLLLTSSTGSNASTSNNNNRRSSSRKSATPSAINTQLANSSSSTLSSNTPLSSSSNPTSKEKEKITTTTTNLLSGLLSPTSASNLTSAQQSAFLEKALAAGISRDEFEKTRASVVSMLRRSGGGGSQSTSTPAPINTITPTPTSTSLIGNNNKERSVTPQPIVTSLGSSTTSDIAQQQDGESKLTIKEQTSSTGDPSSSLPRLSIPTSSTASSKRESTNQVVPPSTSRSARTSTTSSSSIINGGGSSTNSSSSLLSASTSSHTNLSSNNSEFNGNSSAAPSTTTTTSSTFRTSVSSSNTDEGGVLNRESPATSEEGEETKHMIVDNDNDNDGEEMKRDQHERLQFRQQTPIRNGTSSINNTDAVMALSSSLRMKEDDHDNDNILSSSVLSMDNEEEEDEEDSSFNAATAAAAALGMLASSPVKVIERRPSSNYNNNNNNHHQIPFMNGASGMFSQHRSTSNNHAASSHGLVSSSSPPLLHRGIPGSLGNNLGQGLIPSSSSSNGAAAHHLYSSSSPPPPPLRSSSRSPSHFNHINSNKNDSSGDLSAEGLVAAVALGEGSIASRNSGLLPSSSSTSTTTTAGQENNNNNRKASSTTPLRTRLEDIALKSSAQIRRQREILGLGEEEMMDLDTDARHENALLRGAFGDDVDDDDEEEEEQHELDHGDFEEINEQGGRRRRRQSSRRNVRATSRKSDQQQQRASIERDEFGNILLAGGGGLAPAFSYPHPSSSASSAVDTPTAIGRKASRSPSRPTSNGSREGHAPSSSRGGAGVVQQHFSPAKLGSPQLPSLSQQATTAAATSSSASSATATSTSRSRRAGHRSHHRRVSSYGMSGMMDRFMESNYSPKASQIAKFEEAVRRVSPERKASPPSHTIAPHSSSSASYDTDRTLMHHSHLHNHQQQQQHAGQGPEEDEDDDEDVYYEEIDDEEDARDTEDVTIHSTPRTHMDKNRLLRSAGNDLPSPLLQQIRMLSDADHSPRFSSADRAHRERETPRLARGAAGYSARQELGLASGHGSSSEFGSARKRKASYDLQSPRHLVRNMHTSPTPEEEEDDEEAGNGRQHHSRAVVSPPPFPNFEQSQPRFHERASAAHPSSAGLFDGPTPSHSQSSSQSSAGSYRLSQSQPRSSQHAPRQAYAQPHHQYPHSQHQHSRHYVQEHQAPPPHYGIPSHQHPPSSGERQAPVHYQQYPRHPANGADELSHYALAPPRPPSHGHLAQNLHSSHMSRPESVSSDYIPNQRELKKKEKAMKKAQQGSLRRERQDSMPSSTASGPVAGGPSSTNGASGASTLENFVPANVQIGQYDEKTKPPFSYAALIGQAIFSTPNRRMSLADIYTYIMTLYPFYRKQDAGWQNSIRHNLSLNECFVKTQRGPDEPGKGCLWSILPGTEEQFTGGNFYKKGKVPKSALKGGGGDDGEGNSSIAPSSHDDGTKRKKANSVASGTETMSAMSADDSYESQSAHSYSYASHNPSMMQPHGYPEHHHRQVHHYAHHPGYGHPGFSAVHQHGTSQPHGPSSLRQKQQLQYSDEMEQEEVYDEEDESFDMDDPPARYARPEQPHPSASAQQQQLQQHRPKLVVKQPKAAAGERPARTAKRESSPEGEAEEMSRGPSDYDNSDVFDAPEPAERSFSNSDRSGSLEPIKRQQPISHTSPVRRSMHDRQRALLTSPPIMSSPPTNVFARMSQPYQPLRTSFNLPTSNAHAEALMSSPPPSSGIMPSDVRMRRLPPPTPRRASADGEDHPGSHIFLPAPNIKPGKASFGKKAGDGEDVKPTLPPIHMMSPASALALNTQSPVSSVRGSATQHRSSSPSPKSSSQASSSANSVTRSPTLNKSKHLHSSEVFKTPDRFAAPSSRSISSPSKLAHLANNNASKALQALQTPKLGTSRAGHGLVTPGGYYDPYEYGAVLDEELDRMMATNKEDGGRGDRRPLPFPSPVDRTPKWQPWSPW